MLNPNDQNKKKENNSTQNIFLSKNPRLKNQNISLDKYVGQKLRDFRERAALTLFDLAEKIGVSHQQLHKYETGQTKISTGMLYKFCKIFLVIVGHFLLLFCDLFAQINFKLWKVLNSISSLKIIPHIASTLALKVASPD